MSGVCGRPIAEPVLVADPTGEVRRASHVCVGLGISQHHHARHPRQPAVHGGQARKKRLVDDEDLGSRVVDHRRHLGRGQAPVDGDVDGAAERPSEEDLEVFEAVAVEKGHSVVCPDAVGPQGLCHTAGAPVMLRPGHRGAMETKHGLVAVVDDVGPEHADHARTPHRLPLTSVDPWRRGPGPL